MLTSPWNEAAVVIGCEVRKEEEEEEEEEEVRARLFRRSSCVGVCGHLTFFSLSLLYLITPG